jgi:Flp pilus assembly pilin Flp
MVSPTARAAVIVLRRLIGHRDGATAIEYALLAAVVSITAMAGIQAFGDGMGKMYNVAIGAIAAALLDAGS